MLGAQWGDCQKGAQPRTPTGQGLQARETVRGGAENVGLATSQCVAGRTLVSPFSPVSARLLCPPADQKEMGSWKGPSR